MSQSFGIYDMVLFRGSPVNIPLTFKSAITGDPIVLTGLAPFTAQVRDSSDGPLLLPLTVDATNAATGNLSLTAPSSDTQYLPIREAKWDLIDVTHRVWVIGSVDIRAKQSRNS